MAFKIVNGKLIRTSAPHNFGTPEQIAQGKKITGTLGVITGPKTKQVAAKAISNIFAPPAPSAAPSAPITLGPGPTAPPAIAPVFGVGTLGLGQPRSLSPIRGPIKGAASGVVGLASGILGAPLGFAAGITGGIRAGLNPGEVVSAGLRGVGEGIRQLGQAGTEVFRTPITLGRGPADAIDEAATKILAGTGPSPIQLGRGAGPTLNENLFPPGTRFDMAPGGTRSAQLPDGTVVDLTSVETYGRLAAQSLLNAAETGNPDMRPTVMLEEWALSFKNLWENDFENVSDFLRAMGYRQIPGTSGRWIRENPTSIPDVSVTGGAGGGGGGGQFGPSVSFAARGGGSAARGRSASAGLVNWRI